MSKKALPYYKERYLNLGKEILTYLVGSEAACCMNTKESSEVCLHTAYVIVWDNVTIKASLHNSNNNNQCYIENKAELCSMFPKFERLCNIQQEQSLSSKCIFKRMK